MKLLISSWPGSGGTTLALLLAEELNLTWLKGTDVFRFLGSKMNFQDTGVDRIEADQVIENEFGKVFDQYIQSILKSNINDNFIVESDIAGFFKDENDDYTSIFLYSDLSSRKERLAYDNRANDQDYLEHRQKDLAEIYMNLHGINFLDLDIIKQKYDISIDNTHLSLKEELASVYDYLLIKNKISKNQFQTLTDNASKIEKTYWEKGKEYFKSYLIENKKVTTPEEILKGIKKNFPEQIEKFNEPLKSIFQQIN